MSEDYEDYEHTEVITGDELHRLAVAHWDYVKGVIINSESNINHNLLGVIGFHYITAFKHGFKHGANEEFDEFTSPDRRKKK